MASSCSSSNVTHTPVLDELFAVSGETEIPKVMKIFFEQQIAEEELDGKYLVKKIADVKDSLKRHDMVHLDFRITTPPQSNQTEHHNMDLASYKRLSVDSCNNHIKWDKKYGINDANLIPEHPSFRARGRSMLGGDRRSFRDYPDEVGPSRSGSRPKAHQHPNIIEIEEDHSITTPKIGDDIVVSLRQYSMVILSSMTCRAVRAMNETLKLHGWLMDNLRIMMAEEHASKEGTSGTADGVHKYQVSKTAANVGDRTNANEFSKGITAAEEEKLSSACSSSKGNKIVRVLPPLTILKTNNESLGSEFQQDGFTEVRNKMFNKVNDENSRNGGYQGNNNVVNNLNGRFEFRPKVTRVQEVKET
ncbi:hypothetical protein Tco_0972306 [Tanacetum coccineum]